MAAQIVDAALYKKMISSGAMQLKRYADEINDLNVFPIPDGDTGDNMLLTMLGGSDAEIGDTDTVGEAARKIADGMLLSARGNSGVILSQLFDGIAEGLAGKEVADAEDFGAAMREGVRHAYGAVMTPTEGTILTVAREATEAACHADAETVDAYLSVFLTEANRSLDRTPDLLAVLKKAGVVDSGGAGLIRISEGMERALEGKEVIDGETAHAAHTAKVDLDAFTEDSVLEFGYCTELLLRLQNAKTDVKNFDVSVISDYLSAIGNSIVAFKNGSVVKIHVHTMEPYKVLAFCQQYGEYLTVKIENMSLQHNSLDTSLRAEKPKEHKRFGIVTVAAGEGVREMFSELGADVVINGGQSMNPSAKDFLDAFEQTPADVIYVLPNNGNVILAAKQAAGMYDKAQIRVVESRSIGEGHAALSMFNPESEDPDEIEEELREAMQGVITAAVSICSRDTENGDLSLSRGEYIGFVGDDILAADGDRFAAACRLIDRLDLSEKEICILIRGKDSGGEETEAICSYLRKKDPACEVYTVDGGQEIYSYIMIIE